MLCGLGVPPGRLPRGLWACESCQLSLQRCVLQPWPLSHRESRAEIGLGDLQGGLQFLTSWGPLCLQLCLLESGTGREEPGNGTLPSRSREIPPCRSAGEEGLRLWQLPSPSGGRAQEGILASS